MQGSNKRQRVEDEPPGLFQGLCIAVSPEAHIPFLQSRLKRWKPAVELHGGVFLTDPNSHDDARVTHILTTTAVQGQGIIACGAAGEFFFPLSYSTQTFFL